jgi:hypothetical protein
MKATTSTSWLPQPTQLPLFGLLSVLGLSYWFFLGFPFANHNESYVWTVELSQMRLVDTLSQRLQAVQNFRPLGNATAWLGFRLSGGSLVPQQIFNYVAAVLAWLILFTTIQEKRTFSCVALLVGGALFPGYIYLFHLHGVFYSPVLVLMAVLLTATSQRATLHTGELIALWLLTAVTALYHPFALPLHAALTAGLLLDSVHTMTPRRGGLLCAFLVADVSIMKLLVPQQLGSLTENLLAFYTSYRMAELNTALSVVATILSLATVCSLDASRRVKAALSVVVTLLSLACIRLGHPVVMMWILICLGKTILTREWSLCALVGAAAILPLASQTGTPTYTVFVLMACSYVLALGATFFDEQPIATQKQDWIASSLGALALALVVLLRSGVHVPLVSRLVNPMLAEKEKTYQLEHILAWMGSSGHAEYRLVLCEPAGAPTESKNSVERQHRPPTGQSYLDVYTAALHPHRGESTGELRVCFGGQELPRAAKVYSVPGKYSGEAAVYSP